MKELLTISGLAPLYSGESSMTLSVVTSIVALEVPNTSPSACTSTGAG